MGANRSLWLVNKKPRAFAATVLFYGIRSGEYTPNDSAYLGHFAEIDNYVSDSGKKKLEKILKTAAKEVTFFTYPGTHHWFFENDRAVFNLQAAELAWQRTIEFFEKYIT
jgi:carboxymethylenebutenolidase